MEAAMIPMKKSCSEDIIGRHKEAAQPGLVENRPRAVRLDQAENSFVLAVMAGDTLRENHWMDWITKNAKGGFMDIEWKKALKEVA
jgi:hypothetical protein